MVDIEKIFQNNFTYTGKYTNNNNVIDVTGNVVVNSGSESSKLSVEFGTVGGFFNCDDDELITLENSPHTVGENFRCVGNHLLSLEGGPKTVGESYICSSNPLTSLNGIAESIGGIFFCDYNPSLPLLRMLVAKRGVVFQDSGEYPYATKIQDVLNQFKGQGKAGVLQCSHALLSLEKELQKEDPTISLRANIKW